MKKLLSLFLSAAMALTLCACGAKAPETEEPAVTADPNEMFTTPVPDMGEPLPVYPAMTLTVACACGEEDTAGRPLANFADYITKKTNEAIQFDIHWDGSFCAAGEELEKLSSGALDIALLDPALCGDAMPLMGFPAVAGISLTNAMDMMEYIMFANSDTAGAIGDELTACGVKVLRAGAGATEVIASTVPVASYEDLQGLRLGAVRGRAAYAAPGADAADAAGLADALLAGDIDCACLTMDEVIEHSMYEAAPYILIDGVYFCGDLLTIALDTWNGLDGATRALFTEAADAFRQDSLTLRDEDVMAAIKIINGHNAGASIDAEVGYQDDEYADVLVETRLKNAFDDSVSRAKKAGRDDEMRNIFSIVAAYLGVGIPG